MFYAICKRPHCRMRAFMLGICLLPGISTAQAKDAWSLKESIRRVMALAPELKRAEAQAEVLRGEWQQAGFWPNPRIEVDAGNKIGKDDGRGGVDISSLSVTQALPLNGRLDYRRAVAGSQLQAAGADKREQQLRLESEVARRYYALQYRAEKQALAAERVKLAEELSAVGQRRAQAGELSRLENLRLSLIREAAQQAQKQSEAEYRQALGDFSRYLGLNAAEPPALPGLNQAPQVPVLQTLRNTLDQHAALKAARYRFRAAQSAVDLAYAERLPDPELSLYSERDVLNNRRQNATGIGVSFSVPLWDRKTGTMRTARAEVIRARSDIAVLQRQLDGRLQNSHQRLSDLTQQAASYRARVFTPARDLFDLTRKAYIGGEAEILSLIDANSRYFDAKERYLDLLQQAWLESAELRLAAGQSLVNLEETHAHE